MEDKKYILALDQGTTSSRAILFDSEMRKVATAQKELTQLYPKPGYIEQDPMEIYATQSSVMVEVLAGSGIPASEVHAIGITNQRETTIVWNRHTGRPIYNAIVWQCRRTSALCEQLKEQGLAPYIQDTTGLVIDAYFSGTKLWWILDNVPGAREQAERGDLLFGTVDAWLVWKLTDGEAHVTDYTNASRTMFYDIKNLRYDDKLLTAMHIPKSMLPEVKSSSEIYGHTTVQGALVPISGIAGDQQAALFGQNCFRKGQAKNTYGTGCFLLANVGETCCGTESGLVTTIGIGLENKIQYALEGSIFVGGAIIQWLRDEMRLLVDSADSEYFANRVRDNGGVYMVPAFTGLGAPHWDMYARGTMFGLTRGTNRNHIIRAALESIAFQTWDVVNCIEKETGTKLHELRVDGGASSNNFLMQFQSDILDIPISRPQESETTALGAAYLAGLSTGKFASMEEIEQKWMLDHTFMPDMHEGARTHMLSRWHSAVARSSGWAKEG